MNGDENAVKTQPLINNKPVKFARDIIWVGISQLLISLVGIVTLPALTKSYSTETYGIWVQIGVTESLVTTLLLLDFHAAVVRFLAGEEDKSIRLLSLGSMFSAILVFGAILVASVSLFARPFSILLFNNAADLDFVRLTFLWAFVDTLLIYFISYLRARGRIKGLSIIQIFIALCKMTVVFVFAKVGLGIAWIIVCIILIELTFTFGILGRIIWEEGFPKLNFGAIGKFLAFSAPQMPGDLLIWIISANDRYFITHFLSISDTGIYSSSNSLGQLISLFFSPIAFVLLPAVSRAWGQNQQITVKNYFEYSVKLFIVLAIPAVAGVTLLSQPLLKIITTSQYLAGWELVFLIAVGIVFFGIYQINLYALLLIRQTKWIPLMILAALTVNVGMNLILIPKVGIIGAAISDFISFFVLAAIVTGFARKAISYTFDFKFLGKVISATSVMSLCVFLLKVHNPASIILALIAGVIIFFSILFLLKAFSEQDKRLAIHTLSGIFPRLKK